MFWHVSWHHSLLCCALPVAVCQAHLWKSQVFWHVVWHLCTSKRPLGFCCSSRVLLERTQDIVWISSSGDEVSIFSDDGVIECLSCCADCDWALVRNVFPLVQHPQTRASLQAASNTVHAAASQTGAPHGVGAGRHVCSSWCQSPRRLASHDDAARN